MAPSIEGNGLELWRKLFTEYEGSDELVTMAGRAKLLDYPQAKNLKSLNHHIDDWLDLLCKYGDEMGAPAVQTLFFLRIIPDQLRAEVYRRPELKHLDIFKLVDRVRHQTVWERSQELADNPAKPEKVTAVVQQPRQPRDRRDRQQPPQQRPGGLGQRVAGGGDRRGAPPGAVRGAGAQREPNPLIAQFKGCFHCGALDHSRTPNPRRPGDKGCHQFQALLKEHNGLPKNYKGKLE